MATQDYNEAMVPSENCEVWTSFNNVLSISTERLVHRDQRFLNHDGNRNAAHLWSPVTWLEPTFFCGTGEGFYFNSVQRMVHICSRVISPAEHFRNIMPLYDGGAVVA